MADDLSARLEMLLVLRWLDRSDRADHVIALTLDEAAEELDLAPGRAGALRVLGALGELEARGAIELSWTAEPGAGRSAHISLSPELRSDARRLFGRDRPA